MANKFNIKEYENRIKLFFPYWSFKIIDFDGYKKPAKVLCNNCKKILSFKKASDIGRKINACECERYFKNAQEKVKYLLNKTGFTIIEKQKNNYIIKCNNCGTIMNRNVISIFNTPYHCDNCNHYREGQSHYTKEEIQIKLDNNFNQEYTLLNYEGMSKKALLKHKCGHVFPIRELGDLFEKRNRGCPKCYKFKSRGEQAISNFLNEYNFNFTEQKSFCPQGKSIYRFDFFLEDFNLAIEYQGEQHFKETKIFKGSLEENKKRDEIKRNYCLENNIELLEINYYEYNQINAILSSRFNDYLINESREKSLKTDTTILINSKDIV